MIVNNTKISSHESKGLHGICQSENINKQADEDDKSSGLAAGNHEFSKCSQHESSSNTT